MSYSRRRRNRTTLCYTEEISSDDDMSQYEESHIEAGPSDDDNIEHEWLGTRFAPKSPHVLSMEEQMEAFDKKFHLQEAVNNTNASPELKEKYRKAGRLLRRALEETIKIGMSFQCITLVKDQGGVVFAFLEMDLEEIKELISDKGVDAIVQLELPGLACHKDKQEKADDLIRLQSPFHKASGQQMPPPRKGHAMAGRSRRNRYNGRC
ncbi:hypothetical protein SEMRO_1542_G281070.1 [Seminavis robusta]|uniref:Uncharacterized protein n=1 Tax=Seminavis robusta TaxID=568900 RepID=A0A9N8ENQ8_9STRA|nr:hypothetical protein SEMRO_1542_G281070.1 [Seminavis robusta]|eukprot:Sro1542_g281070.1 n/a (208) ;mRNA; r:18186-19022